MTKVFQSRSGQMVIAILILMALLFIRLFVLTVIQNDKWTSAAESYSIKSTITTAPRGEILDRYGRVLAKNVQSFSLRFSASELTNEKANEISTAIIGVLEKNGDKYFDNLPILLENGGYVYTYQKEIEEWLVSQGFPPYYTAQQAFTELRKNYDIDETLDKYEAQMALQNEYKVFPPISVKQMKFLRTLDLESFLGRYGLHTKETKVSPTAEETFAALRVKFGIDETVNENGEKKVVRSDMTDEEARKIMVVRNEVAATGYLQYVPATIASNVSKETVVQIEERSRSLPGVEIIPETIRYYPNGNTASHILGYMGHISEQDKQKYLEKGYNPNDMVGLDGIEYAMESTLKGVDGQKFVQVNVNGELVKVVKEEMPVKGKDIYLSIDLDLQKTAEDALARALTNLQKGGAFESVYGNYYYKEPVPNANVGAVVAIEVETGDVLAMASNPDFDPNDFATGISKENWNALQSKNPRDYLAPLPLYNVAAKAAVAPGSTFKMVTATAALECGLDPKMKLYDGGHIMLGEHSFGCLIWNTRRGSHGSINLSEALEASCNYYFFDISTNYDWYRKRSLGYSEPINIEKIMSYAEQYGLGKPTGIEISETVAPVPTAEKKLEQTQILLERVLRVNQEKYFKPEVVKNKEKLNGYIQEIVSWAEENPSPSRKEILKRMEAQGVKEDQISAITDLCKYSYFNQANWTQGDELNISIGQGQNMYTPLMMANYLATIGNDGVRNKLSLVGTIEGTGKVQKEPGTRIDIKKASDLSDIIKGMRLVASGSNGSLSGIFRNFPVAVAAKTGTAQKSGHIPPPDEVEYVKANLRRLAPQLSWDSVEAEMNRLMKDFPEIYASKNGTVHQAVSNVSGGKVTSNAINQFKPTYSPYAWTLAMAPADDPKIAVAVLIVQGDTSLNAAPVAREVIGAYLQLDKNYEDMNLMTKMD